MTENKQPDNEQPHNAKPHDEQPENIEMQDPSKVKLTVDGVDVLVNKGELLIEAISAAGKYIPRFCYHPRMKPVGMCRMCLVEVDSPRGPTLQPSCYIPVDSDMTVYTDSEAVKKAQTGVLEYLLLNHPLDCPVCDKGGECPLQDQALAYGPGESRFVEEKRHWAKPIAISDLVELDRERCIQCARCTRFSEEVAGEAEIDFLGRGDRIEVATFPTKPFNSYFSGNTIQICPVGALTAKPYRFKSRPWDLEQVESTCTSCAVGCRVAVQSSANQVIRLLGIDVDEVNQSWLCDRGRFGFEAIYSDARLTCPQMKISGNLQDVSWTQAVEKIAEIFAEHRLKSPNKIGVIGGNRLTNESAYAYSKLFKGLIGTDNVDSTTPNSVSVNSLYALNRGTFSDVTNSKLIITIGSDLKEIAPILFLRVRNAVVHDGSNLIEISPSSTELSKYAVHLGVNHLNFSEIATEVLSGVGESTSEAPASKSFMTEQISKAQVLLSEAIDDSDEGSSICVIFSSIDAISPLNELDEILARISALGSGKIKFIPALSKSNAQGSLDMGMYPNLLPGRTTLKNSKKFSKLGWEKAPTECGLNAFEILQNAASSKLDSLVLIGTDLSNDGYDAELVKRALENVKNLISIDTHTNKTNQTADILLPAYFDAERMGTVTNMEGRVSEVNSKTTGPSLAQEDWAIVVQIAQEMGEDIGFETLEEIQSEISSTAPAYLGFKVALKKVGEVGAVVPIKKQTVLIANKVHDPIEVPGISSINRQGAPMNVGKVVPNESAELTGSNNSRVQETFDINSSEEFKLESTQGAAETMKNSSKSTEASNSSDKSSKKGDSSINDSSINIVVTESLLDDGTLIKTSASLSKIGIDTDVKISTLFANRLGIKEGDSIKLKLDSGEIVSKAKVDSGVADNTVVLKKIDAYIKMFGNSDVSIEVIK